jgi:CRP-like cAMP-binding protein/tetratricopeptide (TPR) repeat protein
VSHADTSQRVVPDLDEVDRVRATVAACPEGARPSTIEHALDLAGTLRELTDGLEESGELEFRDGRLHLVDAPGAAPARAALGSLAPGDLQSLHARIAVAIGRTSYEPGTAELEQALHEQRAGLDDVATARLARVAADAMRAADHALVVRAIDAIEDAGIDIDANVAEMHARAAFEVGDARAGTLWSRAVDRWTAAEDEPRAARSIVSWYWSTPEDPDAIARLEQLAEHEDTDAVDDDVLAGWRSYARAVRTIMQGAWAASIEPLERALGSARDGGDRALEAAVLGSLATARSYLGQLDLAIDLLRRSAPLAAADADAVAVRRVRHNLVETLVEALRQTEAIEEAARFTSDLERLGARHYVPGAMALEARVRAIAGDAEQARALAGRSLAADRDLAETQRDVYVHLVAAELLSMGGATARFRGFVDDVADRCAQLGFDSYDEALAEVRARALLVDGDADALAALLETVTPTEPTGFAALLTAAGRLRLEQGDHARLAAAHDRLLRATADLDQASRDVPLLQLALREGTASAARDADELRAVAGEWERVGRPVDAAMLRRALLSIDHDEVEHERVVALLESHGWSSLAARPTGIASHDGSESAAVSVLSTLDVLTRLPAAERAAVLGAIERHELQPPGDDEAPDAPPAGLSIVASGEVRLLRAEPGSTDRRLVVAALGPGDLFGHEVLAATPDAVHQDQVEAATETLLLVIPTDRLRELATSSPAFAAAVLSDATERLAEARLLAGESALLPVETRLARTLVRLAERFGRPTLRGELLLDTSLTHADVASMIGSQRARVSTLLSALHKAGVTDTWKRRIVVLDMAELRNRASLEPRP